MRNAGGALPARHILGNYELFEEIGRGGMGIVYRALDLSLDRIVAVKILRDDLRAHPSIVTRFSREAQAAARLDHANIVQIYSVGAVDRTPYIAMEFVDALPLSVVMQREHRLEWKAALEIARQIAAALACAHDSHVIHRDVKPPNILLDDHGRAYVTDFGIAKILTLDDNLTVDGTRLGTPHYMAPERCKNGEVTASSDLYSLGVLMFQMLTGRLPYEASTPVAMVQRIAAEPPARVRTYVPEVPEDVERLVAWLMEMNPKHRPENGHVVCEAIDRVLAGHPLDANETRRTVALEDFRKDIAAKMAPRRQTATAAERRKRKYLRVSAVVLGVAAMLACAALYWRSIKTPPFSDRAGDPAAWFSTPEFAAFNDEGEQVTMAELQLPGYAVLSIAPAGSDGTIAVMLEQPGANGKRVLATVSPDTRRAGIRFAAPSSAHMELVASAGLAGGSLFDGYGLVRAANRVSFVSLREESPRISAPVGNVAAMHPAGTQWAASVAQSDGSESLAVLTLENGRVESTPIVPSGARIAQIQYSADGQRIAYMRETGPGTYALRVIPAEGVAVEPAPVREGRLSLSSNAIDIHGSSILVSIERDGGQPAVEAVSTNDGAARAVFEGAFQGAWDLRKNRVIFSAPDRKGALQLWCGEIEDSKRPRQLTFLDGGTDRAVLVSGDGQWAAARAATTDKPGLVFVRLVF